MKRSILTFATLIIPVCKLHDLFKSIYLIKLYILMYSTNFSAQKYIGKPI